MVGAEENMDYFHNFAGDEYSMAEEMMNAYKNKD